MYHLMKHLKNYEFYLQSVLICCVLILTVNRLHRSGFVKDTCALCWGVGTKVLGIPHEVKKKIPYAIPGVTELATLPPIARRLKRRWPTDLLRDPMND